MISRSFRCALASLALVLLGAALAVAQQLPDPDHYFLAETDESPAPTATPANSWATVDFSSPSDAPTQAPAPSGCGCGNCANCCECNCPECQKKRAAAAALKAQVAGAYKGVFYDNDFGYIENPLYNQRHFGDAFKQLHPGDCWTVDIGGEYRFRFHDEQNIRGAGLTGVDDQFLLHRTRLFLNARYGDSLRFFGEYIDAAEDYNNFPPRSIEVNRSDILNLFGDVKLLNADRGDLWFRIGRQELIYGAERLISPLDWANTRRTFEGFKFLWKGDDWNVDVFATRPVIVNPVQFDSADEQQEFFGMYATYKAVKNETLDLFAIQYNNDSGANNFRFTTLGGRYLETREDGMLFETEGGVQFGQNTSGSDHSAGYFTQGIGKRYVDHDWKPQVWLYYDWASGGHDVGAGDGFNQLFPLAHKYLGFMDLFGRSNIESVNCQLTAAPHPKVRLLAWYYYLWLQTAQDSPYNVNSTPFNPGNAPASRDLGQELDLTATYLMTDRIDLTFGYSHFWSGNYYKLTPGVPFRGDADFYYLQGQWRF